MNTTSELTSTIQWNIPFIIFPFLFFHEKKTNNNWLYSVHSSHLQLIWLCSIKWWHFPRLVDRQLSPSNKNKKNKCLWNLSHCNSLVIESEMEGIWQHVSNAINQGDIIKFGRFHLFSTNKPRFVCFSSSKSYANGYLDLKNISKIALFLFYHSLRRSPAC